MIVTNGPVQVAGTGMVYKIFPGAPGHYVVTTFDSTTIHPFTLYGAVIASDGTVVNDFAIWWQCDLLPFPGEPLVIRVPDRDLVLIPYQATSHIDPSRAIFYSDVVAVGPGISYVVGSSPAQLDFSSYGSGMVPNLDPVPAGEPTQPLDIFGVVLAAAPLDSNQVAVFLNSRYEGAGGASDGFWICDLIDGVGLTLNSWVPVPAWDTPPTPADGFLPDAYAVPFAIPISGRRVIGANAPPIIIDASGATTVTSLPGYNGQPDAIGYDYAGDTWYYDQSTDGTPVQLLRRFDAPSTTTVATLSEAIPGVSSFQVGGLLPDGFRPTSLTAMTWFSALRFHTLTSDMTDPDGDTTFPPATTPTLVFAPPTWVWSDPIGGNPDEWVGFDPDLEQQAVAYTQMLSDTEAVVLAFNPSADPVTIGVVTVRSEAKPPDFPMLVRSQKSRIAVALSLSSDIITERGEFSGFWGFFGSDGVGDLFPTTVRRDIISWDGDHVDFYDNDDDGSGESNPAWLLPASTPGWIWLGAGIRPTAGPVPPAYATSYDSWWSIQEGPFHDGTLVAITGRAIDAAALRWRVRLEMPVDSVNHAGGGSPYFWGWNGAFGDADMDDLIADVWLAPPVTTKVGQRNFPRDDGLGISTARSFPPQVDSIRSYPKIP